MIGNIKNTWLRRSVLVAGFFPIYVVATAIFMVAAVIDTAIEVSRKSVKAW